jgi:WD40 repeat protein
MESFGRTTTSPPVELTGGDDTFGLSSPANAVRQLDAGTDMGGVTILRLLAEGGMGRVFEARQHAPARRVAVKVVRTESGELLGQRLGAEAALLARLTHPHVAQVYTVGVCEVSEQPVPWIMMELVEGGLPITQYAAAHRLGLRERVELVSAAAAAVAAAHGKGVIHLDLKPSNILVDRHGQVKVIDFGIGRLLGTSHRREATGQVIGTPATMSPEQRAGRDDLIDTRSDIYSLGRVLAELVCNAPDRQAAGVAAGSVGQTLAAAAVKETVTLAVREQRGTRSEAADLAALAAACLAESPADRLGTMSELEADLRRWLDGLPMQCRPSPPAERLSRWAGRHPLVAAGSGLSVSALVLAVLAILWFAAASQQARQQADQAADEARLHLAGGLLRQAVRAGEQHQEVMVEQLLAQRSATLAAISTPPQEQVPASDGLAVRCLRAGLDQALAWCRVDAGEATAVAVGDRCGVAATANGAGVILSLEGTGLVPGARFCVGDGKRLWAAAVAEEAGLVAVAGEGGQIFLVDADTGQQQAAWSGHAGTVYGLEFLARGSRLLSAGRDGLVRLWDVGTKQVIRVYGPVGDSVYGVAFSAQAGLVAAASRDGTVWLWDAETAADRGRLCGHRQRCFGLAFSPDGSLLASASEDQTVRVWESESRREYRRFDHPGRVNAVRFCGPRQVVSVGGDAVLRCWSLAEPGVVRQVAGHKGTVWAIAGGNERPLLTVSADGTVRRWDATGDPQPRLAVGAAVKAAAASADARLLAVGTFTGVVQIWDGASGRLVAQQQVSDRAINGVAWHPQRLELLVAGADGMADRFRLQQPAGGQGLGSLELMGRQSGHRRRVFAGGFSVTGQTLATAGEDGTVRLWTDGGAAPLAVVRHPGRVFAVAFPSDADTRLVASGCEDGLLRVFDYEGHERYRVAGHTGQINTVCFSPRGESRWQVATGGADGFVRLWALPQQAATAEISEEPLPLTLVASLTATAKIWQVVPVGGEPLVAAATNRGEVLLWDWAESAPLEVLRGHQAEVWSLTGGTARGGLWSGGEDGFVRRWDCPPRDWAGWLPNPAGEASIASAGSQDLSERLLQHGPTSLE